MYVCWKYRTNIFDSLCLTFNGVPQIIKPLYVKFFDEMNGSFATD